MELERLGLPTVPIVMNGFLPIFKAQKKIMGLDALEPVVFEHPFTEMDPKDVLSQVEARLSEFSELLTRAANVDAKSEEENLTGERIVVEGTDFFNALYKLNRTFIDKGWGDGFPIVPMTDEAVEKMLTGTKRKRHEVLLKMEPGRGIATVEKVAINCVMAGCEPEHLPVVMAAMEAMHEPELAYSVMAQSTGPHAPLLMINGPIRDELEINYGMCALGPGKYSWANTAIGRAIRLIMMNIGHCYPRVRDMDTIGSPNKYSFCTGENEGENPWEPYHVEKGFSPETGCVTVFPVTSFIDVSDLESSTPEDCLKSFAGTADSIGWRGCRAWIGDLVDSEEKVLLIIAPDHARLISEAGWSKDDIRLYMFHHSRRPWGMLKSLIQPALMYPANRWLVDAPDDLMLPIVRDPSYFDIVVVGGHAGKSAVGVQIGSPVIKEIGD